MGKSTLTVRIEAGTKEAAKRLAKAAVLSVSDFVDQQLKQAIREQSETTPEFKPEIARELDEARADARAGRNMSGPFRSADELMAALEEDDWGLLPGLPGRCEKRPRNSESG